MLKVTFAIVLFARQSFPAQLPNGACAIDIWCRQWTVDLVTAEKARRANVDLVSKCDLLSLSPTLSLIYCQVQRSLSLSLRCKYLNRFSYSGSYENKSDHHFEKFSLGISEIIVIWHAEACLLLSKRIFNCLICLFFRCSVILGVVWGQLANVSFPFFKR